MGKRTHTEISIIWYINGYQDGSFKPNKYITRAELAKILVNIIDPKRTQSFRVKHFISR